MRLWRRRRRTPLRPLRVELGRDQISPGALVSMVSYEVWDSLSLRDRGVLLGVDDCMSGRYDVAELRRRLYPVDRQRIYDDLHLTPDERKRADDLPDDVLQQWVGAAESRENFLEWLDRPRKCHGCENDDAGGAFVTGVAVSHNFGPGCRLKHPSRVRSA